MDESFTDTVINAMGPKTTPRMREVLTSLIRHLHAFAREVNLTTDEWLAGVNFLNRAGQMTDDKRNEGILVSDVVGLESLVDAITHEINAKEEASAVTTATAILGPFWRENAPILENGDSIVQKDVGGDMTWMHGTVTDGDGKPIAGAMVDVWEDAPNGLYEQQDPDQPEYNLRGRFVTNKEGEYNFYCIKPTSYPIPFDGPAGELLQHMDRHPYRPSHIHLIVTGPGHRSLTTQVFSRDDEYLDSDSVFAVKDNLIVDFVPASADAGKGKGAKGQKPVWELKYDIKLQAKDMIYKQPA